MHRGAVTRVKIPRPYHGRVERQAPAQEALVFE